MLGSIFSWPFTGLLWVVEELQQAAAEEQAAEGDRVREDLRLLYLQIERAEISEEEFEAREGPLLDRLEKSEDRKQDSEEEDDDELEEEEDEEESDGDEDGEDHTLAEESENGLSIAYIPENRGPSVPNNTPEAGKDVSE